MSCARLLAAALAFCAPAAAARAAELPLWEAGAGVGVISFPDYRGSDQRRVWALPVPYLIYRGDILRVDKDGMRGLFFKSDRVELNMSLNGSIPVDSEHNDARRGMPDLDPTLEIGPSLNVSLWRSADTKRRLALQLPLRAVIATDLSHVRDEGWLFAPNLNLDVEDVMSRTGWHFGLLAGPIFANRRYNRYFYAVDSAFATAGRPAYDPGAGYAGTQLIASLTKRFPDFWVGGFLRWDTLGGAVFEASPLVKDKRYFAAGFGIAWILGKSKTTVTTANGY